MKLKQIFKIIGISLFLVALLLFLYTTKNPRADVITVCAVVAFGTVLAFSCSCLVTGELIGRIETLETKIFYLEEEIKKLKNRGNENE